MKHFIYIVHCADGTLYTGYATDVERRLQEHNDTKVGSVGAKYTSSRQPVKLVYSEEFSSRSEAMKREYAIKQLSRSEKFQLIKKK